MNFAMLEPMNAKERLKWQEKEEIGRRRKRREDEEFGEEGDRGSGEEGERGEKKRHTPVYLLLVSMAAVWRLCLDSCY